MQFSQIVIIKLDKHFRILKALQKCSIHYGNQTKPFQQTAVRNSILQFTEGRTIVDIGCGEAGGLFPQLKSLKAARYIGIDINNAAIELSHRLFPDANFIWDDPIEVLKSIPHQSCIMSSGVFDTSILQDRKYGENLATVIAQSTQQGQATIHHALGRFMQNFGYIMEQQGLERIPTLWNSPYIFIRK